VDIRTWLQAQLENTPEELFLQGKLLRVSSELKKAVEAEKLRIERNELTYLIWATINSAKENPKTGWRRIHHQQFKFCSRPTMKLVVLRWLEQNRFIQRDSENSYRDDALNG
jgi:hypothetical protein